MFILIVIIFIVGYLAIAFEHTIKIDKTASALIMGVLCWVVFLMDAPHILSMNLNDNWLRNISEIGSNLNPKDFIVKKETVERIGAIAGIIFFLIGAMTIVEIIDRHNGFRPITSRITTKNRATLLWVLTLLAFFMSSILDDLTTTIVLISVLRKLVSNKHDRWIYACMIVLAANAGGAWSPIGDVTTIILWSHGNVTGLSIALHLFPACLACVMVPLLLMTRRMKGTIVHEAKNTQVEDVITNRRTRIIILSVGIIALLSVPVLNTTVGLPPYMGVFLGLGVLWAVAEIIHNRLGDELKNKLSIVRILRKLEISTILFFIGILSAVAALESAGHLELLSSSIQDHISNPYLVDIIIGFMSAIVDNVALVAATIGMYPLDAAQVVYPLDDPFWQLLAFTAGTGGSMLIIGSAAGVAVMGLEKVSFGWYFKNISFLALVGFLSGVTVYYLTNVIL